MTNGPRSTGSDDVTSFAPSDYFYQRGSQNEQNGSQSKRWNAQAHLRHLQDTWPEFKLRAPTQQSEVSSVTISDSDSNVVTSSSSSSSHDNNRVAIVKLEKAHKSFGKRGQKKVILDRLNMTVEKGTIYGLLGASGCGKTTVLSCIVGRRTLDDGKITVFGGTPGDRQSGIPGKRVGYMPQELALYHEFTIEETLAYFGRIYGMRREVVKEQIEFLLKFLDLPEKTRAIRNLSGGQQRRVSFAVSLIHNPELLILDEPTVGVDPMLRQSIWSHLVRLVQEQHKTIIITTHYIEEARQAHCVGLMRNGKLLAEDSPNNLLEGYNMTSLEDVFLKLCVSEKTLSSENLNKICVSSLPQSLMSSLRLTGTAKKKRGSLVYPGITAMAEDVSIQPISYAKKQPEAEHQETLTEFQKLKRRLSMKNPMMGSSFYGQKSVFGADRPRRSCCRPSLPSVSKIWALMMKNFIKLWRNLGQLLFIFLLPAIQVVFFCVAIGRDPADLQIAVVNNELPDTFATGNCSVVPECQFTNLSCRIFDKVFAQASLEPVYFGNEETALQSVKDGKTWAVITVPANFSQNFLKRLWSSIDAEVETLNKSSINVQMDNSNQQVSFVLKRSIADGYSNFFKELLSDCGFPEETADTPLIFDTPVYGPEEANFTDFMAPGIIILIIFFLALALTGELFITEKRDGLLDRSWIAGVLPSEVLIAHVLTQFLILIGQAAITLIFILIVFNIPCKGPVGWLIGLTLLQGTAGMCYGMLLSALFSDLASSMQLAIGSFYPNLLLSGILWPVEGMPWYLRNLAWYLPCTAACQAMRDVMARGWDIGRKTVYLGYVTSSVWIGVFLILSWIVIKLKST